MVAFAGGSLTRILGLILIIVCLPIFAGLGMLSADCNGLACLLKSRLHNLPAFTVIGITASAGIVSMGDIIIQFMPLFGIGADYMSLSTSGVQMNFPTDLKDLKTSSYKRNLQSTDWIWTTKESGIDLKDDPNKKFPSLFSPFFMIKR